MGGARGQPCRALVRSSASVERAFLGLAVLLRCVGRRPNIVAQCSDPGDISCFRLRAWRGSQFCDLVRGSSGAGLGEDMGTSTSHRRVAKGRLSSREASFRGGGARERRPRGARAAPKTGHSRQSKMLDVHIGLIDRPRV